MGEMRRARARRIEAQGRAVGMVKPNPYMQPSRPGSGLGSMPVDVKSEQGRVGGTVSHPLLGQDLKYGVQVVPDDPDAQVRATIGLMCGYAREDAKSPEIQREAQEIWAQCRGNRLGMIQEVWRRVQHKIQFLNDDKTASPIEGLFEQMYNGAPIVEILIRPKDMAVIKQRIGDCDDYSMYVACLLMALFIDCSFVTIAGDSHAPGTFTHVYVAAYPDGFTGVRVPVDASHGPSCGWEGKRPGMRCGEWKVSDGDGEPADSIVSGVLATVMWIGAAVGFAMWALR